MTRLGPVRRGGHCVFVRSGAGGGSRTKRSVRRVGRRMSTVAFVLGVGLLVNAIPGGSPVSALQTLPTIAIKPPTVSFNRPSTAPRADEGDTLTWTVTRTGSTASEFTVPLIWYRRGAEPYSSYFVFTDENPQVVSVTFPIDASEVDVSVETDDDELWERNTALLVCISNLRDDGYDVTYRAQNPYQCAGFNLVNDDDPPLVTITGDQTTIEEGEQAKFTLTRHTTNLSRSESVWVLHKRVDSEGNVTNYSLAQSLTFQAGQATRKHSLRIRDNDTRTDADFFTLRVALAAPEAVFGAPDGTYRIEEATKRAETSVEDDDLPRVSVSAPSTQSEGDPVVFAFTRIDARREALTVNLSFTQAGDYLPSTVPTTITFEQDELTEQISLAVDDGVDELNGGIILEMSTTDAYEIVGASQSTTVFVTDDDEPQFVTLERDATSVVEGEDATFTLTRHFDTGSSSLAATGQAMEWPLAVSVAVTEQGDFIDGTVPTSVTFAADSSTTTLTVTTDDDARPGPLEEAYNTATRFHSAYENDGSISATVSAGTNYAAGLPVAHRTDPMDAETTAALTVQDNEPPLVRATVIPNASDSALRTETFITEGGSVAVNIKRYFYDSDESLTVLLENADFACYDSQQPGVTPRNHAAAEIPLAESSRAFSATIPVGQDSVVATVVSQDDNAAECSMRWNVDVLPPTRPEGVTETSWMERFDEWDYHPLDPDRASITMGDPDVLPVIAFMSPTVDEDDANAEVVVTLRTDAITSGYVSSWPITLNWWTIEQTAMEVEDFTKLESQTVTFPRDTDGGQSDMSLTIPIVDNHTVESTETLLIGYRLSTDYTNNLDLILRGSAPTITILDNDQIPTIDAETSTEVEESDGVATIFLTLDQPSDTPVTVIWTTENGTAKSGAPPLDDDYDATTLGSFTFNPLATLGQIDIPINDDINDEPAIEQFRVRLQSATNGTVGNALTTVSIIDNDLPPIFTLGGHPFGVREGAGTVVYIVELWHEGRHTVSAKEVTVTVTPVDGSGVSSEASATLDVDYMVPNRTVTIRSGRSTGGLGVNIVHDGIDEPLEFFTLNSDQFVGVRQSRLINYSLVIPIGDIDLPSTISLQDATEMEPSSTTGTANATVTAVLNKRSAKAITVTYTTRDGTAKSRVSGESVVFGQDDYTPSTGTITFQPGTTSTTFQIPVKGDDYLEPDETFEVVLSSPTNATIADEAGTVTIQDGSRPPVIVVESFSPSDRVSESATNIVVNFSLNHPDDTGLITSGLNATLDYSVVMFTPAADVSTKEAIRGADYLLPATGTVTITPGSNRTTFDDSDRR